MLPYNKKLVQNSRKLRKGMTDAELLLWSKIRLKQLKGYQFYWQKIIGDYIVDFFSPKAKLVIEVDGSQHSEGEMVEKDRARDDFLRGRGLKVIRYNDSEVLNNIEGVAETILRYL